MKKTIAMADNCIDVYYKLDRYYLTGNSIDFALNYKDLGGDVTEMIYAYKTRTSAVFIAEVRVFRYS